MFLQHLPKLLQGGPIGASCNCAAAALGERCFQKKGEQGAVIERNVRWPAEITASHLLLQSPRQAGEMRCLTLPPKPGFAYEK